MAGLRKAFGLTEDIEMNHRVTGRPSESEWTFEPEQKAVMRGRCSNCAESVVMLRPRVIGVDEGHYLLQAVCEKCGRDLVVTLS